MSNCRGCASHAYLLRTKLNFEAHTWTWSSWRLHYNSCLIMEHCYGGRVSETNPNLGCGRKQEKTNDIGQGVDWLFSDKCRVSVAKPRSWMRLLSSPDFTLKSCYLSPFNFRHFWRPSSLTPGVDCINCETHVRSFIGSFKPVFTIQLAPDTIIMSLMVIFDQTSSGLLIFWLASLNFYI
jgi:hypothetical protein